MDVNQQTLEQVMQTKGIYHMIHGHTHRPAIHDFAIGDQPAQRIVLGDWYQQGSVLICDENGCELQGL
jgi:UDP-2,3-diacylglucosamine hydrolase